MISSLSDFALSGKKLYSSLAKIASFEPTGVLKMAIEKGLFERLELQRSDGSVAEGLAWYVASAVGSPGVLNCAVRLPGYDDARASVDAAIAAMRLKQDDDSIVDRLLLGSLQGLRGGLVGQWLPLGIWALPSRDAAFIAARFSPAGILQDRKTPPPREEPDNVGLDYFHAAHPQLKELLLASPLPEYIKGEPGKGRMSLVSGASSLKLFRSSTPVARVVQLKNSIGTWQFQGPRGEELDGLY